MGTFVTAWAAYGIELPGDHTPEAVHEVLSDLGSPVSYLNAGPYDKDRMYLVTEAVDAEPGETKPIPVDKQPPQFASHYLREAARSLGVPADQIPAPAWFLVADVS